MPPPSSMEEAWRKTRLEGRLSIDSKEQIFTTSSSTNPPSHTHINIKQGDSAVTKKIQLDTITNEEIENQLNSKEREGIENHYKRIIEKPKNFFELQNLALYNKGLFLSISSDKNSKVNNDSYIIIEHNAGNGPNLIHHFYVHVASQSHVSLVEIFQANHSEFQYWNTTTTFFLEEGSSLRYISLKNYNKHLHHFQHFHFIQKKDSRLHYASSQKNGAVGKDFIDTYLQGDNTEFRFKGAFFGEGESFQDQEICAHHESNHSQSSILYKAIVKNNAHSVFDGNLTIDPGLKNIHSVQKNNNLILDKTARAESIPRLKIGAESISCEHGATVGFLDQNIIFYLLSRGFNLIEAKKILTEAFINEIIMDFDFLTENEKENFFSNFYVA